MDYRNGIILVLCILVFAAEYDRLQSYPASIKTIMVMYQQGLY